MAYNGAIVPLVTPLDAGGAVSESSVDTLIGSLGDEVTALMPTLSTGEGWKLSPDQWSAMVAATRKHSRGLPVLSGIQLPTTDEVIERARLAVDLGVDAIVVTTPYGVDVTQDAIVEHFRRIREAIGVGVFLYNEEAVSGNRIELDTLLRICKLPGIVGIKESSGDAAFTTAMTQAGTGIPVFEGWENLLVDVRGVAGFIGPLVNLEPGLVTAALADPTPERQDAINAACEKYGLFTDEWYRPLKAELVRRGVIETDLVVPESVVPA
ncbi:dihydrodipicolinate synthase family protein [Umezawaea sp. NPDC059074]|uniref:dihydrodipicolinate synthase family protein n=1 Tax=Umezawaea sp. NPDC059074 TaxID=3346716 RepID=UPI0036B7FF85